MYSRPRLEDGSRAPLVFPAGTTDTVKHLSSQLQMPCDEVFSKVGGARKDVVLYIAQKSQVILLENLRFHTEEEGKRTETVDGL
ncbi:hypothetical protein AK812_SmicGene7154 [Symbiodinium microadriaticum]|uniref:phosphoglycerate kinase n=1 Tax=Symbiodinium microadriaticum TaxID=2951 RepID=A0A1Q9EPE0_SYMMI|nr:hypothetical protein AK812_SmicGene7154 [Symbiodinium microadriaticum]